MEPILLEDPASGSQARVAAHLGWNCYEFQARFDNRTVDVLDAAAGFVSGQERASGHGIPILFPFPNRIRAGKFSWQGHQYDLSEGDVPRDPAGNAIHGFCLDRPWRVIDRGERFALGEFQLSRDAPQRRPLWPSDFRIQFRYEVRGTTLRADVTISNPDDLPLPWGFGTHPYFRVPLSAESEPNHCLVQAAAGQQWELVVCLPTGTRRPVDRTSDLREGEYFDQLKLDHVLTDLQPSGTAIGHVIMDEQSGLQVVQRCDAAFRELVVYTPPSRNAVCLEPYTCTTDAVNLSAQGVDAGWQVLEPGAEFNTWIEIEAGLVWA